VETVSHDFLRMAEEPDDDERDLYDWEQNALEVAKRIVFTDRFRKLPDKFDVHEWAILEEFALSVESAGIREELLDAIHGTGAFRNFKNVIRRRRIESEWYAFRTEALRRIAVDWCQENQIEWRLEDTTK
jgi:hypothetical protein